MSAAPLIVRTPAKLNLCLDVVGRRPDGYHDIRTVFQAISLFDELFLEPGESFEYRSDARLDPAGDIVRPILERSAAQHGWTGALRLKKSIPLAAGLGGGSSDAALALRLSAIATGEAIHVPAAAQIGADVPFFLAGGTALAAGIGERLQPLPTPKLWFVVHVPPISIPDKTKHLYAGLRAADFGDGSRVAGIAAELASGRPTLPDELPNAFERQMLEHEAFRTAWKGLRELSGHCGLSGAGPAIFSWHDNEREAREVYGDALSSLDGITFLCQALPPHADGMDLRRFVRRLSGQVDTRN